MQSGIAQIENKGNLNMTPEKPTDGNLITGIDFTETQSKDMEGKIRIPRSSSQIEGNINIY